MFVKRSGSKAQPGPTRPTNHMEETMEAEDKRVDAKIRRLAEKKNLVARRSRVHGSGGAVDSKWFFADYNNFLQSPEGGLYDDEALKYLAE